MTGQFSFRGIRFNPHLSMFNCGYPPNRMTERGAELAVADYFLRSVSREDVMEIGAVSPYYWPHRIKDICDPVDGHPLVNIRASMLDIRFPGKTVLSLSTLEHIGNGEYGPADVSLNQQAFVRIFAESPTFLISVPGGYFKDMDAYLLSLDVGHLGINKTFLIRSPEGNDWQEIENPSLSQLTYGKWADSLIFLTRNTIFDPKAPPVEQSDDASSTLTRINNAIQSAKTGQLHESMYHQYYETLVACGHTQLAADLESAWNLGRKQ